MKYLLWAAGRFALLVLFGALMGTGVFAHDAPVEDQIIHSCVNAKSGEIKILVPGGGGGSDDGSSDDKGSKDDDGCKKKDLLLDWNAVGPQGPQGGQGDPGISGYNIAQTHAFPDSGGEARGIALCPAGQKALGGGHAVSGSVSVYKGVNVVDDEPWPRPPNANPGTSWRVLAQHVDFANSGWSIQIWAVCANVN
jgi:hypothetical protein